MYNWWYFDRYSRQIKALTVEIYLYMCHNIVTNVYYGSTIFLGIRVGMGLKIFRLITSKSKSVDLPLPRYRELEDIKEFVIYILLL